MSDSASRRPIHRREMLASACAGYRVAVPHDVPALAGGGVGFEVLDTLVEHLSVPIRYRNLIGCTRSY